MNLMLSVRKLTKSFGARRVIENLSFTIAAGERVTLFAPSGSGKSTLINILSGVAQPDGGDFALRAGRPATIFQEPRLFPFMTVRENIFFPWKIRREAVTGGLLERYQAWLSVCELDGHEQQFPHQLSGGMKQKAAFMRGMMTRPDFVMMDEPFKSIDVASKTRMIRHLLDEYPGVTLLLVTHNLDEIPLLTTTLFVFSQARLDEFTAHANLRALSERDIAAKIFRE